jgi:tetratricopeptide (TPR) repeat protein
MWYQVGPYQAYYYTGRYQDVIDLANTTFSWVSQPVLEESYYWRGMAYAAMGDLNRAIYDFKKATLINPNYTPPRQELERLGVTLP